MTKKFACARYDALSHTLYLTDTFLKKASVPGSSEYNYIREARRDASLRIEKETKPKKTAPKSITFKQMEAYIALFDDENKTMHANFEKIKAMSKIQTSPYKYVKTWFEATFPHYKEQVTFDEKGNMTYVVDADKATDAAPQVPVNVAA